MAKIKNLVDGNKFIAMNIATDEYQLIFGEDIFSADLADNLPY